MQTCSEADTPGVRDVDDRQFIWSEVEPGFYAGSVAGNFLGYINQNLRGVSWRTTWLLLSSGSFPRWKRPWRA